MREAAAQYRMLPQQVNAQAITVFEEENRGKFDGLRRSVSLFVSFVFDIGSTGQQLSTTAGTTVSKRAALHQLVLRLHVSLRLATAPPCPNS